MRRLEARRLSLRRACALALLAVLPAAAWAGPSPREAVALMSSESGPFREALAGLQEEFGKELSVFYLTRGAAELPNARVFIAFGSKASLRDYPKGARVVYAMAPVTTLSSPGAVKICMVPAPARLLAELLRLQPGLKRLGVLWASGEFEDYAAELGRSARELGLVVVSAGAPDAADIPERLRGLHGKIDGLWLPPDPLLLNSASMAVFRDYSLSNRVPLYVPTAGLVKEEATASVGVSFREMGRLAGAAAARALQGARQESCLYPEKTEMVINRSAAAQVGLPLSEDVLRGADRVLP